MPMKTYGSFADWKKDQSAKNQRLASALVRLVKKTAPEFSPSSKWGQGCFVFEGKPKIFFHAEPDHLQFGFFAVAFLKDPKKLLQGKGKHVRHVKIFTAKDITEKPLKDLIKQIT